MSSGTNAPQANVILVQASSPLAKAEQAAQTQSDSQAVGAATVSCPYTSTEEKKVVEVQVVGEDGMGLDGINLLITRGDGKVLTGKTGPAGLYRFKGLEPGSYKLSLPELDKDAWLVKSIQALPEAEANCTSTASWQTVPAPAVANEQTHIIKQGECVGKIAEHYGFFSKTLWDYPANAELKKLRHDNMYILFEKDQVVIPAKRQQSLAAATGDQIVVQRQGVPEYLRIRFLHYDETPRVGVPYLLSVTTKKGGPVADISGKTDDKGFVDQPIPPSAAHATIIVNPGPWPQVHKLNIGYINPIDKISGWQSRLNSLGYDCGAEDDELGPKTRAAIRAFQRAKKLKETGERDEATKEALLKVALS